MAVDVLEGLLEEDDEVVQVSALFFIRISITCYSWQQLFFVGSMTLKKRRYNIQYPVYSGTFPQK